MKRKSIHDSLGYLKFLIVLLVWTGLHFLTGCSSYHIDDLSKYKRNDIQYGVTRGTFRPRWWSYYERGRSFADGGFLEEAERDLRKALSIRTIDDRRSRTYGLHYTQYFGNRELGVLLYRQGRFHDAIQHLKRSLSQDPSEKTEYYLNECQQKLASNINDDENPKIFLNPLPDVTNTSRLRVSGHAEDNNYIDAVLINGRRFSSVLKENTLSFDNLLNLKPGPNTIAITAMDTSGNTVELSQTVILDSEPPLISLLTPSSKEIILSVKDDLPVEIAVKTSKNVRFLRRAGNQYIVKPLPGSDFYYIEFEDSAQNRNGIRIDAAALELGLYRPDKMPDPPYRVTPVLLAATKLTSDLVARSSTKTRTPSPSLRIDVEQLLPEMKVYQDHVLVSGRVSGEFKSLMFDNKIKLGNGKNTRFSFSKYLQPGDNAFELEVTGHDNRKARETFNFERLPEPGKNRDLRARVMLCPLAKSGGDRELAANVFSKLLMNLHEHGRFRMLETQRRDIIDQAQALIRDGWIKTSSAAKAGAMFNADYSLACTIRPAKNDVEIFGRLIDTDTGMVLATCDAYEITENNADIKNIYKRFADKLAQYFPIIQEKVGRINRGGIILDIGRNANIKKGMKFLAFHRGKPFIDSETGQVLVKGIVNVDGILSAGKVEKDRSYLRPNNTGKVAKSQFVVSM